jgi:uncharacterized protein (DUF885 family)
MRWAAALLLVACAHRPPTTAAPAGPGGAGIEDAELRALLDAHWAWTMEQSPEWATSLGDHRFDDRLSDPSVAAAAARHLQVQRWAAQARALTEGRRRPLGPRDAMFLQMFLEQLDSELAGEVCHAEQWELSPRSNVLIDAFSTLALQPAGTADEVDRYVARLTALAARVEAHSEALRVGLRAGRVANRTSVARVLEAMEAQLALPAASWPPVERELAPAARERAARVVEEQVRPAVQRYAALLRDELLPAARGDDRPGLAGLPDGAACYAARVLQETTLPLDPAALHATGLAELARIHAELRVAGARSLGLWDRSLLFARLRGDPELRFADGPAIVAGGTAALRAAEAAVPRVFGRLPRTPCGVEEIPAYEAPYTSVAYYQQPSPDGTRGGAYYLNTYAPETRPRFELQALTFHESVPGHHLQIALSYELDAVPAFVRYNGATAFVEGWALYAERLADELGLYTSELDRVGMMSYDTWRAARLVVDTGLHQLGWSRDEAIAFFEANTPLAHNNIVNEVDRYIAWPGQALAYKVGQLELRELRRKAEGALGDRFRLAAFHDVVLGEGAVSLEVLRARVDAWIAAGGG